MSISQAKYLTNLPQVAYTAQAVQVNEGEAARLAGTTLSALMQRAAGALFEYVSSLSLSGPVLILTGKGNNGGDGYVLAHLCHQAGIAVEVLALFDPEQLQGDARAAYRQYQGGGGKVSRHCADWQASAPALIVDAVFGSGFRGQLPEHVAAVFRQLVQCASHRLAVDIPSGVNGSTSEVARDAFVADVTITFIALKQGLLTGSARHHSGTVYLAELGVGGEFAQLVSPSSHYFSAEALLAKRPVRPADTYKNRCGHVLLIGGGPGMAGAIRLAAEACLRAGAGLVSVATHPDNQAMVLQGRYELMVHGVANADALQPLLEKADTIVIGPGLGQSPWARALFDAVRQCTKSVVVDADGLNLLAGQPRQWQNAILTPHWGEAKRLSAAIATLPERSSRFEMCDALAQYFQACVVLKGPGTLVQQAQCLNINRSGCAAMASAGMGDVLSGIIAALLAQGLSKFDAAMLAVYIHGLAAEKAAHDGAHGLLASDLFVHIRGIIG
ncbi:NAD(P)H-hydrate dehydratase [Pseudoalteromonas rubra]|uniref:Bifunctional NAD(P)H-hydrate repair enzyme n=1 Tax=Pseudoalteromonas rubra TaxID=43658 RepID=A0A5S3X0N0_9GAMM|nr:NAD(P)H-hydrate dehydratase [Pseudoalteromonas rubra]TMP37476.1 bifunctional ADP-dependent NAD(P)H-hydrate dehydratase/NAD(P)H-hydrate epimerase [Pseudoalteromonas rubra]